MTPADTAKEDHRSETALSRIEGTAVVFLTSAASLIVEIVAGRMLAPFVGMSLYTWTSVIAVVLAGLSLGHWIGGHATERFAGRVRPFLAIVLLLAAASTLAAIAILPAASSFLLAQVDTAVGAITALALAAFFLPSVAAGIPSPLIAAGLVEATPDRKGQALGGLFAAGAIGSIAGTLLAGYLFISWLGSTRTLIVCAAIYVALALLIGARARRRTQVATLVMATGLAVTGFLERDAARFCDVESRYFCIRTVDITAEVGEPARLMVLDHLAHSMSSRGEPRKLLSPYLAIADTIARTEKGESFSAFFIGGGAYSLPRAWADRGIATTIAEIDPVVTDIAEAEFWFDPATSTVVHSDARIALGREAIGAFDVVIGDAFTDVAVPPHLVTVEFASLVSSRLTADGLYLLHFVAPAGRLDALFAMKRTLAIAFPAVDIWFDADPVYSDQRRSFMFVARKRGAGRSYPHTGTWQRLDPAEIDRRTAASGAPVLTDDFSPIDRLVGMAGIGID